MLSHRVSRQPRPRRPHAAAQQPVALLLRGLEQHCVAAAAGQPCLVMRLPVHRAVAAAAAAAVALRSWLRLACLRLRLLRSLLAAVLELFERGLRVVPRRRRCRRAASAAAAAGLAPLVPAFPPPDSRPRAEALAPAARLPRAARCPGCPAKRGKRGDRVLRAAQRRAHAMPEAMLKPGAAGSARPASSGSHSRVAQLQQRDPGGKMALQVPIDDGPGARGQLGPPTRVPFRAGKW